MLLNEIKTQTSVNMQHVLLQYLYLYCIPLLCLNVNVFYVHIIIFY